jgi:hypothetical protein
MLSTEGQYRQVHSGDVKVYENLTVLPRAYAVHHATSVTSDDAAIELLKSADFDSASTVLFVGPTLDDQILGQPSPHDDIIIRSYTPEHVVIEASLESPGWLVFTDAFYPGWQATVNDQPVDILTANILFRAIQLPAGNHIAEFTFAPQSFKIGALISGILWIGLITGLVWAYRKRG